MDGYNSEAEKVWIHVPLSDPGQKMAEEKSLTVTK